MLTLLLIIIILGISIFLSGIFLNFEKRYLLAVFPLCCAILSFVLLFSCLIDGVSENIFVDGSIQKKQIEYEYLIKQIEELDNDNEDVSSLEVIQKVSEWNQDVFAYKYGQKNPWTNIFYNKRYANSLKYIELDNYDK